MVLSEHGVCKPTGSDVQLGQRRRIMEIDIVACIARGSFFIRVKQWRRRPDFNLLLIEMRFSVVSSGPENPSTSKQFNGEIFAQLVLVSAEKRGAIAC